MPNTDTKPHGRDGEAENHDADGTHEKSPSHHTTPLPPPPEPHEAEAPASLAPPTSAAPAVPAEGAAQLPVEARGLLVLAPEGTARDALRRALLSEGYKVDFCTSLSEVVGLLTNRRPAAFLHDFTGSDESQARQLEHRLSKLSEYEGVVRVAIVETITPGILAHANDVGLARVIPRATPPTGVASAITMALTARRAGGGKQRLRSLLTAGSYSQADVDSAVEKAFSDFPHDPDVKLEFGNLLVRRDELSGARRHGEELLARTPTNVRAMNLVARTLMKEGRFDQALDVLRNADSLSPDNPGRLVMIGDAFFGKGDVAGAGKAYGAARALDPGNKEAAAGLGQVKLSEGDAEAALALFQDSLSQDEAVGFFNNAGVAAVRAGKVEEGLRLYDTALAALKSAANRHQILFNKALALRKKGDTDEAIKALRKAVKLAPGFEKAAKLLVSLEEGDDRRV